ncbi:MAG: GNAT family N-acetyltransferase [Candidatus Diapherotrites archaeon]|nr:GNAT family N-acetyltransferase [Candidatus Diapherotrites archaeon]
MKRKFKLIIRPLSSANIAEVLKLIKKEFSYLEMTKEKIAKRMQNPNVLFYEALFNNRFAGFIEAELTANDTAQIFGLAVKKEFRGRGIGKKLLLKIIEILKKKKIARVFIFVEQDNKIAKRLYNKVGFKFMGLHFSKAKGKLVEELELNLREERPSYVI